MIAVMSPNSFISYEQSLALAKVFPLPVIPRIYMGPQTMLLGHAAGSVVRRSTQLTLAVVRVRM